MVDSIADLVKGVEAPESNRAALLESWKDYVEAENNDREVQEMEKIIDRLSVSYSLILERSEYLLALYDATLSGLTEGKITESTELSEGTPYSDESKKSNVCTPCRVELPITEPKHIQMLWVIYRVNAETSMDFEDICTSFDGLEVEERRIFAVELRDYFVEQLKGTKYLCDSLKGKRLEAFPPEPEDEFDDPGIELFMEKLNLTGSLYTLHAMYRLMAYMVSQEGSM
ncbi:hypothetical protein GOV09_01280 [Candidatus Woesearchaeota archaeon]|nr:hypothetical protein [Candidatus Woesearchaeota archaeon]